MLHNFLVKNSSYDSKINFEWTRLMKTAHAHLCYWLLFLKPFVEYDLAGAYNAAVAPEQRPEGTL